MRVFQNKSTHRQVNTENVLTQEKAIKKKRERKKERKKFHISELYNLKFSPYLLVL